MEIYAYDFDPKNNGIYEPDFYNEGYNFNKNLKNYLYL